MKTLIRWTQNEWLLVIKYLHKIDPIKITSSTTLAGIGPQDVYDASVNVLPSDRIRPLKSLTQNPGPVRAGLLKHIQTFRTELKKQQELTQVHEEETESHEEALIEETPQQSPFDAIFDQVADRIIDRLFPRLEERIAELMVAMQPTISYGGNKFPINLGVKDLLQPQTKKRKLGVVGLLPIQAEQIKNKFRDIDFIFIENGPRGIRESMGNCEAIFNLTSKGSHSTDAVLQKWAHERHKRVTGGPTAVERAIRMYLAGNTEEN